MIPSRIVGSLFNLLFEEIGEDDPIRRALIIMSTCVIMIILCIETGAILGVYE